MIISKTKSSSYKNPIKTSRIKDCPYCKSGLTETERDFFPCTCSFQACIDCYKDIIRTKGRCPTCHNPLRGEKLNALNASKKEELAKSEVDRVPKKDTSKKTTTVVVSAAPAKKAGDTSSAKISTYTQNENSKFNLKKMNLTELLKVRILQRNLVYVIGLAPRIAKNETLGSFEYFGQYGKITKIIVNKNNAYNPTSINGPSYSAYLTFSNDIEASIAILAVDQYEIYDRTIRASYGTTKYCTFFLRDQACPNPECLYLHRVGNDRDCFMKDESNNNKNVFIDQQKMAVEHLQRHLPEIDKSMSTQKSGKTSFPSMGIIKAKVKEYILENTPPEPPVEKLKPEERKTSTTEKEPLKEKATPKQEKTEEINKTPKKAEPADNKSEIEDKTPKKDEDQELNKPVLESNKSSISCQSTAENEGSANKEGLAEQKANENVVENGEVKKDDDNNKENIDFSQYVFRSLEKDNKEDGDKKVEFFNQTPYHNDFDKKIVENVFGNLKCRKNSRFKFAQENSQEDFDEIKREEEQRIPDVDLEFNCISKSIQDYMETANSSSTNTTKEEGNIGREDGELKKAHYGLFNNGFENTGAQGEYKDDSVSGDQADNSAGEDKKGSGSKSKRGKNKRKKGSNSKDINANKTNINGDFQV